MNIWSILCELARCCHDYAEEEDDDDANLKNNDNTVIIIITVMTMMKMMMMSVVVMAMMMMMIKCLYCQCYENNSYKNNDNVPKEKYSS